MKKFIPNLITLLNLFCGVLSIYLAFRGHFYIAAILILLASVFDFFDGFTARLLNAYSDLGKELDSLADLVSFGVAPAMLFHKLVLFGISQNPSIEYHEIIKFVLVYFPLIIPLFSAYRLAKFNIDDRQTTEFIGLPTPAVGIFLASIAFVYSEGYIVSPHLLVMFSVVLSFLMVSETPMMSLKFKNFNVQENLLKFILVGVGVILLACLQLLAIPLIIIFYLFLSLAKVVIGKRRK